MLMMTYADELFILHASGCEIENTGGRRPAPEHRPPEHFNPEIKPQWRPAPRQTNSLGLGLGLGWVRVAGAKYVEKKLWGTRLTWAWFNAL